MNNKSPLIPTSFVPRKGNMIDERFQEWVEKSRSSYKEKRFGDELLAALNISGDETDPVFDPNLTINDEAAAIATELVKKITQPDFIIFAPQHSHTFLQPLLSELTPMDQVSNLYPEIPELLSQLNNYYQLYADNNALDRMKVADHYHKIYQNLVHQLPVSLLVYLVQKHIIDFKHRKEQLLIEDREIRQNYLAALARQTSPYFPTTQTAQQMFDTLGEIRATDSLFVRTTSTASIVEPTYLTADTLNDAYIVDVKLYKSSRPLPERLFHEYTHLIIQGRIIYFNPDENRYQVAKSGAFRKQLSGGETTWIGEALTEFIGMSLLSGQIIDDDFYQQKSQGYILSPNNNKDGFAYPNYILSIFILHEVINMNDWLELYTQGGTTENGEVPKSPAIRKIMHTIEEKTGFSVLEWDALLDGIFDPSNGANMALIAVAMQTITHENMTKLVEVSGLALSDLKQILISSKSLNSIIKLMEDIKDGLLDPSSRAFLTKGSRGLSKR